MLTYEKVLEVFGEYLEEDECCEVVNTSRGYTVMIWDTRQEGWNSSEIASSPEELRDMLLDNCDEYLTCKIFDECKRESLTEQKRRRSRPSAVTFWNSVRLCNCMTVLGQLGGAGLSYAQFP